jgi:hypothetical protein
VKQDGICDLPNNHSSYECLFDGGDCLPNAQVDFEEKLFIIVGGGRSPDYSRKFEVFSLSKSISNPQSPIPLIAPYPYDFAFAESVTHDGYLHVCGRVCMYQLQTLLYATLRHSTLLYATLRNSTLHYSTLLYATLLYATLLYAALRYSTLLYAILRYSTLLYATLRYSTLRCAKNSKLMSPYGNS